MIKRINKLNKNKKYIIFLTADFETKISNNIHLVFM